MAGDTSLPSGAPILHCPSESPQTQAGKKKKKGPQWMHETQLECARAGRIQLQWATRFDVDPGKHHYEMLLRVQAWRR